MKPAADRRAAQRKPLHTRAQVFLGSKVYEVRTFDISAQSIGIYSEVNLPVGLSMGLACVLQTPNKGPMDIRVQTQVARSVVSADGRGFKVGLTLLDVDPPTEYAISLYLG